jgi:hypothetical protein
VRELQAVKGVAEIPRALQLGLQLLVDDGGGGGVFTQKCVNTLKVVCVIAWQLGGTGIIQGVGTICPPGSTHSPN